VPPWPSGVSWRIAPADLRRRLEAFGAFERWEQTARSRRTPADAVAAATWLYDLLPAEAKHRAVDVSGVQRLHAHLKQLVSRG
jgi:hypothetical protein